MGGGLVGFLDAVDQLGIFGQAKHLYGDAAQQKTRQAAAAVAADKNQIALFFFGGLHQAIGHVEIGHGLANSLDLGGGGPVEHRLQVFLSLLGSGFFVIFVGAGLLSGHAVEAHGGGARLGYAIGRAAWG